MACAVEATFEELRMQMGWARVAASAARTVKIVVAHAASAAAAPHPGPLEHEASTRGKKWLPAAVVVRERVGGLRHVGRSLLRRANGRELGRALWFAH